MKEEMRVQLLDSATYNGKLQVEDSNGEVPIVDNSSHITFTLAFSAFAVLSGSLSLGFAIGYSSPVQSEIMKELGLSTSDYSLFGSMTNVGGAVGAILCGKLTDYLGRRQALGLADIFYILGWFSIVICNDAWLLDLGRCMLGFAMTINGFVVPIFIAEFTPTKRRGGFIVIHALMVVSGSSIIYLLGLIISWRSLAFLGIIPSLVQIISLFFIPESPRWLMMIGENEKFEAALRRFRGAKVDISQEMSDIMVRTEALEQKQKVSFLQLFQKKYAYTLTVGFGLSALPMLVGFLGILSYARSIFESAGFSGVVGTITLAIFQVPSVVLGIYLADKCGRRTLLMISSAGLCLGCLLTGLSFTLQDYHVLEGFSPYVALIGILVYVASYPLGVGGVAAVVISEIYPLNIKGLVGSITTLLASFLAWLVTYAFNFSMEWSPSGTFYVFASVCVITLIFAARLVPETKGKTLEEVHFANEQCLAMKQSLHLVYRPAPITI